MHRDLTYNEWIKYIHDYQLNKNKQMKTKTLQQANELFKLYDINTFIKDNKIFLNLGDIEIEISKEEIKQRANQFINLKTINK